MLRVVQLARRSKSDEARDLGASRLGVRRSRRPVRLALNLLLGFLALVLAVTSNIASNLFPKAWTPYAWFSLPAVVVIVLLGEVIRWLVEPERERPEEPAPLAPSEVVDGASARPTVLQLLPETRTFVGRAALIADLTERLEEVCSPAVGPGAPLVLLVHGGGGVGKTCVLTHVAYRVAHLFPDGCFFVDMLGATLDQVQPKTAEAALDHFLRSLDVPSEKVPAAPDERAALFRSEVAGRRCLFFVDNARTAAQVRPLLTASTGSAVLVTSRWTLAGLDGVDRHRLGAMTPGESVDLLRLLVEPAAATAEPRAVAAIAELCGHLPLALRIAGQGLRLRGEAVTVFRDRLQEESERLNELGEDDVSVRATFNVTFQTLGAAELSVFCRLGDLGFRTFSPELVSQMLGQAAPATIRVLDALVGCGMLERPTGSRVGLHDLVRLYAAEQALSRMPVQERKQSVERALRFFHDQAEEADRKFVPQTDGFDQLEWSRQRDGAIAWFEAERENLPIAIERARSAGLNELAAALTTQYFHYFDHKRYWADWEHTHRKGIAAAREAQPAAAHDLSKLLCGLGLMLWEQSRLDEARACQQESLAIAKTIGDVERQGWAWTHLGNVQSAQGDHDQAIESQLNAVACFEQIRELRGAAWGSNQLGDIHVARSELDIATKHYLHSGELFARANDLFGSAIVLANRGLVALKCDKAAEAEVLFTRGREMFLELHDSFETARVDDLLGVAAAARGDDRRAAALHARAAAMFRELKMIREESEALLRLAGCWGRLGDTARAQATYHRSAQLAGEANVPHVERAAQRGLTELYQAPSSD